MATDPEASVALSGECRLVTNRNSSDSLRIDSHQLHCPVSWLLFFLALVSSGKCLQHFSQDDNPATRSNNLTHGDPRSEISPFNRQRRLLLPNHSDDIFTKHSCLLTSVLPCSCQFRGHSSICVECLIDEIIETYAQLPGVVSDDVCDCHRLVDLESHRVEHHFDFPLMRTPKLVRLFCGSNDVHSRRRLKYHLPVSCCCSSSPLSFQENCFVESLQSSPHTCSMAGFRCAESGFADKDWSPSSGGSRAPCPVSLLSLPS